MCCRAALNDAPTPLDAGFLHPRSTIIAHGRQVKPKCLLSGTLQPVARSSQRGDLEQVKTASSSNLQPLVLRHFQAPSSTPRGHGPGRVQAFGLISHIKRNVSVIGKLMAPRRIAYKDLQTNREIILLSTAPASGQPRRCDTTRPSDSDAAMRVI